MKAREFRFDDYEQTCWLNSEQMGRPYEEVREVFILHMWLRMIPCTLGKWGIKAAKKLGVYTCELEVLMGTGEDEQ